MSYYPEAFTDPANYALSKPPSPTLAAQRYRFNPPSPNLERRSDLRRSTSTYGFDRIAREPALHGTRSSQFDITFSARQASDSYASTYSRPISSYGGPRSAFLPPATFNAQSSKRLGGYRDTIKTDEEEDDWSSSSRRDGASRLPDILPESPVQSRFGGNPFDRPESPSDPIASAFASLGRPSTAGMSAAAPSTASSSSPATSLSRANTCKQCGDRFDTSDELETHKATAHWREKPHQCVHCGVRFARKFDCDRHERIHTGERPYTCSQCNATFARRDALSRHVTLKCVGEPSTSSDDVLVPSMPDDSLPSAPAPGAFHRIRRSSSRIS